MIPKSDLLIFDKETYDPRLSEMGCGGARNDGHVAGIAVKVGDYLEYLPIGHHPAASMNLPHDETAHMFCDRFRDHKGLIINHNLLYDLEWLVWLAVKSGWADNWKHAIRKLDIANKKFFCTQIAEALIDNTLKYDGGYSLEACGQRRIGEGKEEDEVAQWLIDNGVIKRSQKGKWKSHLWKAPAELVANYAKQDVVLPEKLFHIQKELFDKYDLWRVAELEFELMKPLLEMRFHGVRVDVSRAEELYETYGKRALEMQKRLNRLAGFEVSPNNAGGTLQKLWDSLGLEYGRSVTGKPSFTSDVLTTTPHEVGALVNDIREIVKAKDTFIKGYILDKNVNGRLHGSFKQVGTDDGGTISGRFSSANPNLQNLPNESHSMGREIRGLFLPEENQIWMRPDFKQQEPRVTIHYGYVLGLPGAKEARERYIKDPRTDTHNMASEFTGLVRKDAKIANLGKTYLMGLPTFAKTFGKTMEEAKAIYDIFDEKMPYIKAFSQEAKNKASARGYVKTFLGRRAWFNMWQPAMRYLDYERDKGWFLKETGEPIKMMKREEALKKYSGMTLERAMCYKAGNNVIQGTSADMCKQALLDSWRAGYLPLLTVHDENDFSVDNDPKVWKDIEEIHINALQLTVPMACDIEVGENWGSLVCQ